MPPNRHGDPASSINLQLPVSSHCILCLCRENIQYQQLSLPLQIILRHHGRSNPLRNHATAADLHRRKREKKFTTICCRQTETTTTTTPKLFGASGDEKPRRKKEVAGGVKYPRDIEQSTCHPGGENNRRSYLGIQIAFKPPTRNFKSQGPKSYSAVRLGDRMVTIRSLGNGSTWTRTLTFDWSVNTFSQRLKKDNRVSLLTRYLRTYLSTYLSYPGGCIGGGCSWSGGHR